MKGCAGMKFSKTAIILILLLNLCTFAYAEKPNWVQVYAKSEAAVYLDKSTYKTYLLDNKLYIDAWLKVTLTSGDYSLGHFNFEADSFKYTVAEFDTYTYADKLIDSKNKTSEGWKTPAPGSNLESIFKNAAAWVRSAEPKKTN